MDNIYNIYIKYIYDNLPQDEIEYYKIYSQLYNTILCDLKKNMILYNNNINIYIILSQSLDEILSNSPMTIDTYKYCTDNGDNFFEILKYIMYNVICMNDIYITNKYFFVIYNALYNALNVFGLLYTSELTTTDSNIICNFPKIKRYLKTKQINNNQYIYNNWFFDIDEKKLDKYYNPILTKNYKKNQLGIFKTKNKPDKYFLFDGIYYYIADSHIMFIILGLKTPPPLQEKYTYRIPITTDPLINICTKTIPRSKYTLLSDRLNQYNNIANINSKRQVAYKNILLSNNKNIEI